MRIFGSIWDGCVSVLARGWEDVVPITIERKAPWVMVHLGRPSPWLSLWGAAIDQRCQCPLQWLVETKFSDSQGKPILCLIPTPLPWAPSRFICHGLPISLFLISSLPLSSPMGSPSLPLPWALPLLSWWQPSYYTLQNHNIGFDLSELCTNHIVLKT